MKTLIFVYNADSGPLQALMQGINKVLSPSTYDCKLCTLTYTPLRQSKRWKQFIKDIPIKSDFIHRDEFVNTYKQSGFKFPAIFLLDNGSLQLLADDTKINSLSTLNDLEKLVTKSI